MMSLVKGGLPSWSGLYTLDYFEAIDLMH